MITINKKIKMNNMPKRLIQIFFKVCQSLANHGKNVLKGKILIIKL